MKNTLVVDNGKTTWFMDGAKTVIVKLYDKSKYEADSKKVTEVECKICGFGIYNGSDIDTDEYEDIVNNDMVDEYDEYLRLWINHNESMTFRNSNVDMFLK